MAEEQRTEEKRGYHYLESHWAANIVQIASDIIQVSSHAIKLDVATKGRSGIRAFIGICVICAAFGIADTHVKVLCPSSA
ncbi:hypothetical protein PR202_gb21229 [Eleusine coracana subsp. coracana]|uniref:Uncharacterized protein n=1 Tax=Eleusine coracana subsp. coracana TaxID=191504 RepID=A0AAV5FDJ2_ELECO|nr:hypothetical protein PR202_gb21229 [Eleusine coracana subsp. coracana]